MEKISIINVPKGEYFKRKPTAKKVYVRSDYCRSTGAYEVYSYDNINERMYIKGDKQVYIGFTF